MNDSSFNQFFVSLFFFHFFFFFLREHAHEYWKSNSIHFPQFLPVRSDMYKSRRAFTKFPDSIPDVSPATSLIYSNFNSLANYKTSSLEGASGSVVSSSNAYDISQNEIYKVQYGFFFFFFLI
jgi:hypothetical protein